MPLANVIGGAGDGKTTLLVSLAQYDVLQGREPTIADANPDQNAADFLGAPSELMSELPKISEHWEEIREILEGNNPDYPNINHIAGLSPLTANSVRWDAADPNDPIVSKFSLVYEEVRLMQTGTYRAEDIGSGCLHSKIDAMTFMLNRMQDGNGLNKLTLIDNAHGRDAFGTPLFTLGDVIVIPTSATPKSCEILRDYLDMARTIEDDIGKNIPVIVVGNKLSANSVEYKDDMDFIREIAGDRLVAGLVEDRAFARKRSNAAPELHEIASQNLAAIETVHGAIWAVQRDYELRARWMARCLRGADYLDKFIDPSVRQQDASFVPHDHSDGHHHHAGCGCPHHEI